MAGYGLIVRLRKLEAEVDKLGFMMCHTKYGVNTGEYGDLVALKPKDADSLPIYSRDAELFCGTINELEVWIHGVQWARQYDCLLKLSDDKKRERKEQDERNRRLVQIIKNEKVLEVDK
jgi:hypothetical protein